MVESKEEFWCIVMQEYQEVVLLLLPILSIKCCFLMIRQRNGLKKGDLVYILERASFDNYSTMQR